MADFTCNLLIMGQTGTGKSSLLNYVFGTDFKTGAGKPVTGEGFYESETEIANQKVRVFDSWGLEPGKLEKWQKRISEQLAEHGADKPMEEWFHTIIYCIQAGGARVQDIDLEMIKAFINNGYSVSIVLTKADQLDEVGIETMKKTIVNNLGKASSKNVYDINVEVIPVCAAEKTLRDGTKLKPFGKDEIVELILKNWRKTVVNIMPAHIIERINTEIDCWKDAECKIIENRDISGYDWGHNNDKFKQDVSDRAKVYFDKLANETLPAFIKEDLENCQKVDVFLNSVTAPDVHIEVPEYYNKVNAAWKIVGEILSDLAVVPFIVKCIMSLTNNCIEKEKSKLEAVVENIAYNMKKGFSDSEDDVAKCIAKALGVK